MKIVRRMPFNEVLQRLSEIEKKYGESLGEIEKFTGQKFDRTRFEDYVEWLRLRDALEAFREGEDFDYYVEDTIEVSVKEASRITPKRIELLDRISRTTVNSINDLALKTGRDVKNVYNDLKALESLGFVRLMKDGNRMIPKLLVQEITLFLA